MAYYPPKLEDNFDHEFIQQILWENEGNIERSCVKLHCTPPTLRGYLDRYPESKKIRVQAKKYYKQQKAERMEAIIEDHAEAKRNAPVSFAAARYYLEAHGKEEGWGKQEGISETEQWDNSQTVKLPEDEYESKC